MKLIAITTLLGLVLLYFLDIALKIPLFTLEMMGHSLIRFVAGFVILGISVFYAHVLPLKNALYTILALVLADDIFDYVRQIDSFTPEVILHSIYMLLWGAATGYVSAKAFKPSLE